MIDSILDLVEDKELKVAVAKELDQEDGDEDEILAKLNGVDNDNT